MALLRFVLIVLAAGAVGRASDLQSGSPAPAGDAAVGVTVTDDTGAPLAEASVILTGRSTPFHRVAETDVRGGASFTSVPAGDYVLAAEKPGHIKRAYGQQGAVPAIVIALDDGETFAARIALPRSGSISGQVVERGRSAPALVRLHSIIPAAGKTTLRVSAATRTDETGAYRIADVAPGEYIVSAIGNAPADPPPSASGEAAAPLPVFHPGTSTAAQATRIRVVPGDSVPGINMELKTARPAKLEGVVLDENGQPAGWTPVHITRTDELESADRTARTSATGDFQIVLPAGSYRITTELGGVSDVVALSGLMTPVTVRSAAATSLTGRVEFAGAQPRLRIPVGVTVAELVPRDAQYPIIPLRLEGDDRLLLLPARAPSGQYAIRIAPFFKGWMLESIQVGPRTRPDDLLHVAAGAPLDFVLTLTERRSVVSGTIVDASGAPRFDRRILVFSAEPGDWIPNSTRVRFAQPDTNGRFAVEELPAGDYFIAAIEGLTDNTWDRALLGAASRSAVRVVVLGGSVVVQNVRVSR